MPKRINVLVVDDSVFMRQILTNILQSDPDISVAAVAKNGQEALEKLAQTQADVITMDINMPKMDGLTALKHIMASCPTPVIMISALTQKGADETLEALAIGAVDFIAKPSGSVSFDLGRHKEKIISKVKAASTVKLRRVRKIGVPLERVRPRGERTPLAQDVLSRWGDIVVAIGSSTGGPTALFEIIPALPADLNATVLLVQHMPPIFTKTLAKRLNSYGNMPVKEAEEDELIEKSKGYVAQGGANILVKKDAGTDKRYLKIDTETTCTFKPNVNLAFNSIVEAYAPNIIGVILTGMGSDGADGIANIKRAGGKTIAEDESSSVVFGMPKAAIQSGQVDYVLPADEIAQRIVSLVNKQV